MAELKKNPLVTIVMSTYNGAAHIRLQMDSLFAQTYPNIRIVVRDDGSKDDTVSILQAYQNIHSNLVIMESDGKNLKCPGSFYEILQKCEKSDYYAFCDQDDYWNPEKIQWAVEMLEDSVVAPKLYLSSYDYETEDGTFIRKFPEQKGQITVRNVMYYSPGSGFTLVFNEALRQKMVMGRNPGNEMHDKWMIRGAACFGKIYYDSRSTARHIRYQDSVTAEDSDNKNLLVHFIRDELLSDTAVEAKRNLRYYYEEFQSEMKESDRKEMKVFLTEHGGIKNWFQKVCYPHRLRTRFPGEVALRLLFFIGKI